MNSRERIKAAINYQAPDRLPCGETYWDDTLPTWREQGLPRDVDPADFFGHDISLMYLDASPRFDQRAIEQHDNYLTFEDRFGYTCKKFTDKTGTLAFLKHVTTDKAAWEAVRQRFEAKPDEPARIDTASYFAHFDPYPSWAEAAEKFRRLRATGRYIAFRAYGPWNATWRHRGFDQLLLDIMNDPEWVAEMADRYHDLVIQILERCMKEGMKPDAFYIFEDLAHNRGMMFSPDLWRAYLKPTVMRLGDFLRRNDIDFWMHSDGNLDAIIEDMIECGLKVLNPLQVAAGYDAATMVERYRGRLAFYGNIFAHAMSGPAEEIEAEVRRKAAVAVGGGYIIHSDHSVPPVVSLERYQWLLKVAREAFDAERARRAERAD